MKRIEISPSCAEPEAHQVRLALAECRGQLRDEQGGERGKAVVGGKQHADPVRAFVVGDGGGVGGAVVMLRHGRGRVDPHREQREPREELHHRELPHHLGHEVEIVDDVVQHAVRLPALLARGHHDLQQRRMPRDQNPARRAACPSRRPRLPPRTQIRSTIHAAADLRYHSGVCASVPAPVARSVAASSNAASSAGEYSRVRSTVQSTAPRNAAAPR